MDTLYWLINTQTIGGVFVLIVFGFVLALYFLMIRWIVAGAQVTQDSDSATAE